MNPEQWLSLKWNGGSTMSDRWLNQSKIIHPTEKDQPEHLQKERIVNINAPDSFFLFSSLHDSLLIQTRQVQICS